MLNITVDKAAWDSVTDQLKAPKLNRAVAMALRETQRNGATRAAQLIAKQTKLKSSAVKKAIRTPGVKESDMVATIEASRRGIPLIEFPNTYQHATGVQTSAWGKPTTIPHAFEVRRYPQFFRRRPGAPRLPIEKLWGPNVFANFVVLDRIRLPIQQRIADQLPKNLARRMAWQLSRR